MKSTTMYVVVDCNEQPYESFDTIEDAYWGAMECGDDHGYPIYIDKIEWKRGSTAEVVVEDNDMWIIDNDGEAYGMDCAWERGILWNGIITAESKRELRMFEEICLLCDLSFNKKTRRGLV